MVSAFFLCENLKVGFRKGLAPLPKIDFPLSSQKRGIKGVRSYEI
jgi:hypothetical protein